jgi:glycosyltransferase involved in cell wall biosynthesis
VLLLAYWFPPLGGAGVQRNTKVVQHLPERGYNVTVVTGPGAPDHRWAPVDETLAAGIPAGVDVHRLPGPEPSWAGSRVLRWLRLRREWQRWWERHAVPLAVAVGHDADVVYASLAPFSTAAAAATIARTLGKPLVLDLEDPWALDEMLAHETGLHAALERRTMRRALAQADTIVMNTPEAAARVRTAFPELESIPVTSIVNGFDAEDFAGPAPERDPERFRIVHTGSLHTAFGSKRGLARRLRGGTARDVDYLPRSLVYLKQALEAISVEHPELGERLELHVAGRLTDRDREVLVGLPVVDRGFLSHAETIELIRSADLLFLPMHDVPPGRRISIVPCKTYEYLGSGRPILAAVPDGDARDFLSAAGNATLVRPKDVAGMKSAVLAAMARANETGPAPSPALRACLERRRLTDELVAVLESVSAAGRPATRARVVVTA